ncbi:23S rRNA (adenine(2030)-N(6))-methyltransferase RlmJ [Pseudorhodobacter turbinis]|uniref:Ribosomal RNA large subunit methyltransferase J n=1 Tax=Pseudorhodobacter turbinis TaxID=2500533 RepID=A0A4P8ECN8_9RHOB|nr:23S rRNA (adenine(2030)-N(6))-methyltransferase RlmJ [Pseudorhodobacter turbinis]QCO54477.1 23S rRNA (adenine(2030)-N(6))-methyltransferase RlmJ [Pseudorhodobacter turbinis]
MLSYQHHYHAGNPADVHKHALLAWMLDYLVQKDKPITYLETHAGRGLYDLGDEAALKTGEAEKGVLALEQHLPKDHPYRQRLNEVRFKYGEAAYPGSPLIAAMTLREQDTIHLAELHPGENAILAEHLTQWDAHIRQQDGFKLAQAVCPPTPRRGMMLVDPSYEVKAEYDSIPKEMAQIARKWNVGILALWYPLLTSGTHGPMLAQLTQSFPDALRHEVRFGPVRDGHRMIGSGMFIINPPYGLAEHAKTVSKIF